MEFDWVEWFGYLASMVVLVSLTMTSIIKLRVINLVGCILFALFAYFIDSYPTMFMNLGIAGINLYFLWHIHTTKEQFILISTSTDSEYFKHFLSVYKKEIEEQVSTEELQQVNTAFYMLRNNKTAGILAGEMNDKGELEVRLDYVTPEYRDFKLAQYYYQAHPEVIKQRGITSLKAKATTPEHKLYLEKVGFSEVDGAKGTYFKKL